jgi:drug/metabolite transporter (DMT)-like permease
MMLSITLVKSILKIVRRSPFRVPTSFYLGIAVLIFAASNSVTRKVVELGQQHLVNGRNPISLCNVLFIGNICAFLLMALIFYKDWTVGNMRRLNRRDWLSLTVISTLSGAIAPALIFTALDQTNVTNVVLIGRLEPPLTLALSIWLLRSRVDAWTVAGTLVTFFGVAAIALMGSSWRDAVAMGVDRGEIYTAIAAIVSSIATVLAKLRLQSVPLGIFSMYRNIVGTTIFFFLATALYGSHHFIDAFSPILWKWMLVYAGVIVVLGQLCWLAGLRKATPAETSLANSCTPVLAIAIAYVLLREVPTGSQWLGGGIIAIGIILNLMGRLFQRASRAQLAPPSVGETMAMSTGFRGL